MEEYLEIVNDILNNSEFQKLSEIKHHGGNRLDHCKKVSYYSYLLSKKLKLDYVSCARAGLLHDFFMDDNINFKMQFKSFFIHPKKALNNSKKYFKLNKLEENIILTHMFPASIYVPTHRESFLVSIVDKLVAQKDFMRSFEWKIIYKPACALILILLYMQN